MIRHVVARLAAASPAATGDSLPDAIAFSRCRLQPRQVTDLGGKWFADRGAKLAGSGAKQ